MRISNLLLTFIVIFHSTSMSSDLVVAIGQPQRGQGGQIYPLICNQASGDVIYNVEGLPTGAVLQGDQIFVGDNVRSGNFVLRVKAIDSQNTISNQILTLVNSNDISDIEIINKAQEQVHEGQKLETVSNRLGGILNSFSSVESIEQKRQVVYEGNRYPVQQMPIGGDKDAFNPTPEKILNKQTIPTDHNRNSKTVGYVTLISASERHQNSIKGITNILKLIDQSRGNKKQAEKDVQYYTKKHNDAIVSQRKAQNTIISVENRIVHIRSAIEGIQALIEELRGKLDQQVGQRQTLETQKQDILITITQKQTVKAELMQQLDKINDEMAEKMKQLADQKQKCQQIQDKINESKLTLEQLKKLFSEIFQKRMIAQKKVDQKKRRVNQLIRQLSRAQKQLADAQIDLAGLEAQQKRIPTVIRDIQGQITKLENDLNRCNNRVFQINDQLDDIKNDQNLDITQDLKDIEKQVVQSKKIFNQIESKLANDLSPLQDNKDQLQKAQSDIVFLKQQLRSSQDDLRRVYILGNQANTKVIQAKDNLDTAIIRYKKQMKIVADATLNLQKVRAQEALARRCLQQIIAKYSDALPYSIIPNGNGFTNVGAPVGNNPVGSALGPPLASLNPLGPYYVTSSTSAFINVNDFPQYIANQYGRGLTIRYQAPVQTIYAVATRKSGNIRNDQCAIMNQILLTGQVISKTMNTVDLLSQQGEVFQIHLSCCSNIFSNVERHKPDVADICIIKGDQQQSRIIHGYQVLCLTD